MLKNKEDGDHKTYLHSVIILIKYLEGALDYKIICSIHVYWFITVSCQIRTACFILVMNMVPITHA